MIRLLQLLLYFFTWRKKKKKKELLNITISGRTWCYHFPLNLSHTHWGECSNVWLFIRSLTRLDVLDIKCSSWCIEVQRSVTPPEVREQNKKKKRFWLNQSFRLDSVTELDIVRFHPHKYCLWQKHLKQSRSEMMFFFFLIFDKRSLWKKEKKVHL